MVLGDPCERVIQSLQRDIYLQVENGCPKWPTLYPQLIH